MTRKAFPTAQTIAFAVMLAYGLISLFPFVWALMVALTPLTAIPLGGTEPAGVDIMKWPPQIDLVHGRFFGAPISGENFVKIFIVVPQLARWLLNTVVYALVVSAGVVFFNTVAAYAFARLRFPMRDFWFTILLASMMVPFPVTMIPVYTLLVGMDWVNTYQGLIIPKLINVAILFFMRQSFLDFPKSLEEAAFMDGASIPRILFRVVLPNSRPALAAQAIYVLLGAWNEFLWPLIVTSHPDMFTLTMGLNFFRSTYVTIWQYVMAASLLVTVPMILVFLVFRRQFVESQVSSAIKG